MRDLADIRVASADNGRRGNSIELVAEDLALARVEDELSARRPPCLDGRPRTSCWSTSARASLQSAGAHVVVPVAPNLFSLQGLRNLGPTCRSGAAGGTIDRPTDRLSQVAQPRSA